MGRPLKYKAMVSEDINAVLMYAFDAPPPILYHYSSMETLLSIVATGRIRATHIHYLNDVTEATWVWESAIKRLRARVELEVDEQMRQNLTNLIEMTSNKRQCTDFVASFSEKGDDLNQWRAYCPTGNGFSIGFDSAALRTQWVNDFAGGKPAFVGGRLSKVRYLSCEDSAELDAAVDQWIKLAPIFEGKPGFNGHLTGNGMLIAWLSVIASSFKDASFRDEREWRMLLSKPHKPMPFQRFRVGKSSIVPYIEVELNRNLHYAPTAPYMIKEVRVSPTPDASLSIGALKSLFLSLGHPEVEIVASSIPYRHW